MPSQTEKQKTDRVAIACRTCRRRKVRCSGGRPCRNCSKISIECTYPSLRRRKRAKENPSLDVTVDQTPIVDSSVQVLDDDQITSAAQNRALMSELDSCLVTHAAPATSSAVGNHTNQTVQKDPDSILSSWEPRPQERLEQHLLSQQYLQPQDHFSSRSIDRSPTEAFSMSDGSTAKAAEYPTGEVASRREQEPCAWMSACSEAGIAWVCEATGSRMFVQIAERFTKSMHQRLSANTGPTLTSKGVEPTEATAWEYVDAFFENCWEARIGLIHRSDFEAQLHAHFRNQTSSRTDYAMIALRNVVFAAGYRSILANTASVPFTTAQTKPWQSYFKNSLAVLTKLLLSPPRLMTVQALALMACYVEGLGSPGFQRVLCCNAVHAAITQGLHRESDYLTESSSDDSLKKAWLWWALYIHEKHTSLTSGRTSMIDDHIRSTRVPSEVPRDSNMDLECLSLRIRHAEISSRISREIMLTKASKSSTDELLRSVKDLDQQLKNLVDDIPPNLQIGMLAKPSEEGHLMSRHIQALHLHFSIYGSLLAVHSQFFFPWMSSRLLSESATTSLLESQITLSSSTVAEAARKILLAVRTVTTNVTIPTWLAFFYPIYAHVNLFIYILKYPTLSTVSADLGLLDVCAGHFGHIEYVTSSEISVSLPRDSVNLASKAVKAAKKRERQGTGLNLERAQCMQSVEPRDQALGEYSPGHPHIHRASPTFGQIEDFTGIEAGGWNFLPFFDTISGNDFNFEPFEV